MNDLTRKTASDKILRNIGFDIAKNPEYDGYQRGLNSMTYNFLDNKLLAMVLKMKICQTKG